MLIDYESGTDRTGHRKRRLTSPMSTLTMLLIVGCGLALPASAQTPECQANHQVLPAGSVIDGALLSGDGQTMLVSDAATLTIYARQSSGDWASTQTLSVQPGAALAISPTNDAIAVGLKVSVEGAPRGAVNLYTRDGDDSLGLYKAAGQHLLEGPVAPADLSYGVSGTLFALGLSAKGGNAVVSAAYADDCCLSGTLPFQYDWPTDNPPALRASGSGVFVAAQGIGKVFSMTLTPKGDTASWTAITGIPAPIGADLKAFGTSIAGAPGTLIVGSPGDQAAYVYQEGVDGWELAQTIAPDKHHASEGNPEEFAALVLARDIVSAIDAGNFDPADAQAALEAVGPVLEATTQGAIFTAVVPFEDDPTGMPYAITVVAHDAGGTAPAELEDYYFEQGTNPVINFPSTPELHVSAFFVVYHAPTGQWLLNAVLQGAKVNDVNTVEFQFLEPYDPPPSDVYADGQRQVKTFWNPRDLSQVAATLGLLASEGDALSADAITELRDSVLATLRTATAKGAGVVGFGSSVAVSEDGGWAAVGATGHGADYVYAFPKVTDGGAGETAYAAGPPYGGISGTIPQPFDWELEASFASGWPPNTLQGTLPIQIDDWPGLTRVVPGAAGNGAQIAHAAPRTGLVTFDDINACTDLGDSDGDGIADDLDACPTEPAGSYDSNQDGCPDGRDLITDALTELTAELFDDLDKSAAGGSHKQQKRVKQARKKAYKALDRFDTGRDTAAFNKLSAAVALVPRTLEGGDAARLDLVTYADTLGVVRIEEIRAEFPDIDFAAVDALTEVVNAAIEAGDTKRALRTIRRRHEVQKAAYRQKLRDKEI